MANDHFLTAPSSRCPRSCRPRCNRQTAFPLTVIGPGFIGTLWSIFLFKEIQGKRNFQVLGGVFLFAVCAAVSIVVSRS
jgi:hypothetical protein